MLKVFAVVVVVIAVVVVVVVEEEEEEEEGEMTRLVRIIYLGLLMAFEVTRSCSRNLN